MLEALEVVGDDLDDSMSDVNSRAYLIHYTFELYLCMSFFNF